MGLRCLRRRVLGLRRVRGLRDGLLRRLLYEVNFLFFFPSFECTSFLSFFVQSYRDFSLLGYLDDFVDDIVSLHFTSLRLSPFHCIPSCARRGAHNQSQPNHDAYRMVAG